MDISYADGQVENIKVSLLFLLCTNFAGRKRILGFDSRKKNRSYDSNDIWRVLFLSKNTVTLQQNDFN